MNDTDRAIVAAAEERDRKSLIRCRFTYVAVDGRPWECGYTQTVEYAHHGHEFTLPEGAAADRRELLRIVREQEAANDKSPDPRALDSAHRCLDIERLAEALDAPGVFEDPLGSAAMELAEAIVREYEALEQDRADDAAATEATKGSWR